MDLRVTIEPQRGASYEQQLAVAQTAERLGFSAFFRSDHFARRGPEPQAALPGPTDAWVTLGAIARETSTIRLGTLVTSATFRHPGLLAVTVAQIDAMSGGRVELGIGSGWEPAEHRYYGIPYPPSQGERFDRFEEQLEIITGLWTTPHDERYSFTGTHYVLENSPALPKPVQTPRPNIIIGGAGPVRTPRIAARWADEFNLFGSVEACDEQFARVRAASEKIGRDPSTIVFSAGQAVVCGRDGAELARRAAAAGLELGTHRGDGVRPDAGNPQLAGTPAQILEQIHALEQVGATRIYLQLYDATDLEHLELLAAEVLPHLS